MLVSTYGYNYRDTVVILDEAVVTVVNCCQSDATRLFFMFPFGRERYSGNRTTRSRQLRTYENQALMYTKLGPHEDFATASIVVIH